MTKDDCLKLAPDFRVSEQLSGGEFQVGAEWTSKGVPCSAFVRMKPERTPKQQAFFTEQLFVACHRMMTEDAA